MALIPHSRKHTRPRGAEFQHARVCYNHLTEDPGTQMFGTLMARRDLALEGGGLLLTRSGEAFVRDFGIDLPTVRKRDHIWRTVLAEHSLAV